MSVFSEWLIKEMQEGGWSQNRLAEKCGLASSTMSRLVHGTQKPHLDVANALADVFKVTPQSIMEMAGTLPPAPQVDVSALTAAQQQIYEEMKVMDEDAQRLLLSIAREINAWRASGNSVLPGGAGGSAAESPSAPEARSPKPEARSPKPEARTLSTTFQRQP